VLERICFITPPGQSFDERVVFSAAVFAQIGVFDASYRVAGDREFMLRLACSGLRCGQISRLVYRYRIHPGSMTFGGNEEIWQTIVSEHNRMTADYLRKPALSKRARSLLTRTRTRETLQMAIRSARNRRWRLLVFYARAGIRYDAFLAITLCRTHAGGAWRAPFALQLMELQWGC